MRSSLVILVALAACGGHAGATQPCFPAPGVSEYAARIYGVVLDADGRAIPGVRVTARSESPVEHRMFQLRAVPPMPPRGPETVMFQGATDDLGRYRLMVQPAAYDVRFESDTLLFSWHHVTAAPGAEVRAAASRSSPSAPPPSSRSLTTATSSGCCPISAHPPW